MITKLSATLALGLFLLSCPPNHTVISGGGEAMGQFYATNHWVPLPEPDSRFSPGSVFTYTKEMGFSWVGDLASCNLPASILTPKPGDAGKLTFNTSSDYGASAVLKIGGVSAGPEFSKVKKTTLELSQHGPSSLNMLDISMWINDPANVDKFPNSCKAFLNQPNTYIVREAYAVSQGKYTLKDSTNAKISVTGLKVGPVSIAPDAHASPSQDGSLEFNQRLYTAVRRLQYSNGDWRSLGQPEAQSADEKILGDMGYK